MTSHLYAFFPILYNFTTLKKILTAQYAFSLFTML